MANRGRPTNAMREARAQEAARQAEAAVPRETPPEPQVEAPVEAPVERPVEEKDNLVRRPPRNDARDRAMKEVTDRDIKTKQGLGIELGLTDEEQPKTVEKQEIPPDLPPPTAESMLQGGKFSQPTVRVKVDDQEFDVDQSEIDAAGGVRSYQIQKASENRLNQAKQALAEIQKLKSEAVESPKAPDDFVKQKLEVMKWGTPEESAKAFQELMDARKEKPVDQNQMVEMVADRIRHDDAVKKFDDEFKDIGASNLHLKLIVAMRNERLAKGHPGDWNNFYRSLGNEVRAIMPRQNQPAGSQAVADTTSQLTDKEARKSSIVNLPQAAARAATPEEPKTESRQDILNNMRKKRGFPTG